jgi:hypothetical protein
METPRIKISHAYGEMFPNVPSDYEWVFANRPQLLQEYGTCVLLVYEKKVIGKGKTLQEAMEDAERNLPPEEGVVTPVIELLAPRPRLYRVQQSQKSE